MKQNGLALEWASDDLKKDKEVALAALKNTPHAMFCVEKVLLRNLIFCGDVTLNVAVNVKKQRI